MTVPLKVGDDNKSNNFHFRGTGAKLPYLGIWGPIHDILLVTAPLNTILENVEDGNVKFQRLMQIIIINNYKRENIYTLT